jgi:hypothetical protein
MLDGDADALATFLHADLHYVHANGREEGKAGQLDVVGSGKVRYGVAEPEDVSAAAHGGVVALRGRVRIEGVAAGNPFVATNLFKSLWIKEADSWQMVSWIAVRVS